MARPDVKDKFNFSEYEEIFRQDNGTEKFAIALRNCGKDRVSILHKVLNHIIDKISDIDERDKYLMVVVESIAHLAAHSSFLTQESLNDLVNGLVTEIRHFGTNVLSDCVENLLEYLKSHADMEISSSWRDIFVNLVTVLAARDDIKFLDDVFNGDQCKVEIIDAIMALHWRANNAASLVAMLKEITGKPSPTELRDTVRKAQESLQEMNVGGVAPFAYQLLGYIGNSHASEVLSVFDVYFREANAHPERNKAIGDTVYHFIQFARVTSSMVKEMATRIRLSGYDSSILVNRFNLAISLGLTQMESLKQMVVLGLRNTVVKYYSECQLSNDTLWYHKTFDKHPLVNLRQVLHELLESKLSELDFMFEGLKELGIGLLCFQERDVKDERILNDCKELAFLILKAVVEREKDYFPQVFNNLLKNQNQLSYDCLAHILKSLTRTVVEHCPNGSSKIHELINHLPMLTVDLATPIIKAVLPALQLSPALMNDLVMMLRKNLWKSIGARKVSLTAMMILLSNLRIISELKRDDDDDEYLNDSQMPPTAGGDPTPERSATNELMCSEIVAILKRYFNQECEVREQLYTGMDPVLSKNIELINETSTQLLEQVKLHMTRDCKNIRLQRILEIKPEGDIVVKEELGLLLQAICSVVRKARKTFVEDMRKPVQITECEKILNIFVNVIFTIKPDDFEIQAGDLTKKVDGTAKPLEMVRYVRNILLAQMIQVIESFIEFIIFGGRLASTNAVDLFKKFKELEKSLHDAPPVNQKEKSASKKKKESKDKENDKDQLDTTNASSTTSSKASEKRKLWPKVLYIHIISLKSLKDILELFYTSPGRSQIMTSLAEAQFENYLFELILHKVGRLTRGESLKEYNLGKKARVKILLSIAQILWKKSSQDASIDEPQRPPRRVSDSDIDLLEGNRCGTVNKRLEIILGILNYVSMKHAEWRNRLIEFGSVPTSYGASFQTFFNDWEKIFHHFTGASENPIGNAHLFSILHLLILPLSPEKDHKYSAEAYAVVHQWITRGRNSSEEPSSSLVESVYKCYVCLAMKIDAQPKVLVDLAKNIRCILGDSMENVVESQSKYRNINKSWLITKSTAPAALCVLLNWADKMIKLVNNLTAKFASCYHLEDGYSDFLRNSSIHMSTHVIYVLVELACSAFPAGQCGDMLLKISTQFFISMTSLTEEIQKIIVKQKREMNLKLLEKLVKEIGGNFKRKLEACIHYIELLLREEACEVEEKVKQAKLSKAKKGKTVPSTIMSKFAKDVKTVPMLVYHIEKYDYQIVTLAEKAKVNLLVGTKLNTPRDFKIHVDKFKQALDASTTSFDSNLNDSAAPQNAEDVEMQNEPSTSVGTKPRKSTRAPKRKAPDDA